MVQTVSHQLIAVQGALVLRISNLLSVGSCVRVRNNGSLKVGLESVIVFAGVRYICEFEFSKSNRCKGNVVFFGKSQQGVTFSCSRLTMEKWCSTEQDLFVIDLRVKNVFDTKLLGLGACSRLAGCLFRCVAMRV